MGIALILGLGVPFACAPQPAASDRHGATLSPVGHRTASEDEPVASAPPASAHPAAAAATATTAADHPHDAAVREAASQEVGAQIAATMPALPPTPPPLPADPGAQAIVTSITSALSHRETSPDGVTLISARDLRNLSRANAGEFAAMRARLCELLTAAGRSSGLVFTDRETPAIAPHYRLLGSAYLVTADGFDHWEMYLSLTPAIRDFQVWDARGAVRLLRLPRGASPQITYLGR